MDIQIIIVGAVILSAIAFGGFTFARKTKAFSTKNDCGSDCGCDSPSTKTKSV